jgi:hypothetical protein
LSRPRRGAKLRPSAAETILKRAIFVSLCVLAAAAAVLRPAGAHPAANCTTAEKTQREAALAAYLRQARTQRAAYFKTHRSAAQRAAFVKRQQQTLKALRAAAACTVPTMTIPPPSAGPPCAPSLASSSADAPNN